MRNLVWPAVVIGVFVLAGCLGPDSALDAASHPTSSVLDAVAVQGDVASSLTPAIDPWFAGEVERVLFEEPVGIEPCVPDLGFYLQAMTVYAGCSNSGLAEGRRIPEGTLALRIESDAGAAPHVGSWGAFISATNAGYQWEYGNRDVEGEPTAGSTGTWTFPLEAGDWDAPTVTTSALRFGYYAYGGPANVMTGPIQTTVIAVRDPAWAPMALADPWQDPARVQPQPGVLTLLDSTMSWTQPDNAGINGQWAEAPSLTDTVPSGAQHVVVALSWTPISGCPPAHRCWTWANMYSGAAAHHQPLENQENWQLYLYTSPDQAAPDSAYAPTSGTQVQPSFFNCDDTCAAGLGAWTEPPRAELRIVVEAWQGPVDWDAVKARVGLGSSA